MDRDGCNSGLQCFCICHMSVQMEPTRRSRTWWYLTGSWWYVTLFFMVILIIIRDIVVTVISNESLLYLLNLLVLAELGTMILR